MKRGGHIEHVTDHEVQRFLLASWVELANENDTLRRRDRYMKKGMIALVALTLLVLAAAARAEDPKPPAKPTAAVAPAPDSAKPLTDAQKLEIREYQLRAANAQQQLDQLELRARDLTQAQQQNNQQLQARVAAIVKEACAVPQGCDLDYESLAVRSRPAPAPPASSEKK